MSEHGEKFDQAVEDMRNIIRRDVAGGFRDVDGIAEGAVEAVTENDIDADALEPIAERVLAETLAEHYRAQAGWPDRTDCDRLDEAFAELESRGIVCRQDFTCCSTCGQAEIGAEMGDAEDEGVVVKGYVFYHSQDTDAAVEGRGVYLKYGAVAAGDAAGEAIGRETVEVLTAHGLRTEWSGRLSECVRVFLDWKRRRPFVAGFGCGTPRGR